MSKLHDLGRAAEEGAVSSLTLQGLNESTDVQTIGSCIILAAHQGMNEKSSAGDQQSRIILVLPGPKETVRALSPDYTHISK